MAKIVCCTSLMILSVTITNDAMLHEPFPTGCAMATLGAVIDEQGVTGRNPLVSAAFMHRTCSIGATVSIVSFYDNMDNMKDRCIIAVAGGCYVASEWLSLKIGISHFDALGAYYEQTGYLSCAGQIGTTIRYSAELAGTRMYADVTGGQSLMFAETGLSLFIRLFPVCLVASVRRLPIKTTGCTSADPFPVVELGINTARNIFGTQGVRITVTPGIPKSVTCAIAQEIRVHNRFSLSAALGNNPLLFGFGVVVSFGECVASTALVNHPILGWSRGFSLDYHRTQGSKDSELDCRTSSKKRSKK